MTTEDASSTMTTTNKRVRITEPVNTNLPILKKNGLTLTPKGMALTSVRTFAMTLRDTLSPIILNAGETHITLLHKWTTKVRQLKKMEDDDEFIPRSARLVNFEFRVTKEVENSEEFKTVNAETQIIIQDFRIDLKLKVMATLRIDIALIRDSLIQNFMKHLNLITKAKLLTDKKETSPHLIVSTFMHYHHEDFLLQTDMELEEFNTAYKKAHALPVYPIPPTQEDMTDDMEVNNPALPPDMTHHQQYAIKLRDDATNCYNTVTSTLSTPVTIYFEKLESIKIDISLKKLNSTAELEDAAVSAQTRMDLEPSAEPELVKDLIREQVASENKKLSAELGQLKRQLALLTSKSGGSPVKGKRTPKGGASTKKQITKKNATETAKAKGKSPKAGARGPDSSKNGGGKNGKKKKKKPKQRS